MTDESRVAASFVPYCTRELTNTFSVTWPWRLPRRNLRYGDVRIISHHRVHTYNPGGLETWEKLDGLEELGASVSH